jgi:hypothetical protein
MTDRLDPIDPGAVPLSSMSLTKAQALKISAEVEKYQETNRLDSIRLEKLQDAYVRLVFIGPDGNGADEILLFPV